MSANNIDFVNYKKHTNMEEKNKGYGNIKINDLKKSQVEIEGEITAEKFNEAREKALKKIGAEINVPGFRRGHIPESVIIDKIGETAILEEAAETALGEEYPNIIIANKIDAIGRPEISITKIAKGNPLGFKIKTYVLPKFTLPDYKEIAKKEMSKKTEKQTATDKEVEEVITELRRNKAHEKMHEHHGHEDGEGGHGHGTIEEKDFPPADDAFAKSFGFKDIADLKEKIKENISKEKEVKEKDRRRLEVLNKIIEKSEIEVPEIMIESEVEKMIARLKDDTARVGLKFEDYLKEIKKTEEDMRKEWQPDAEKKSKLQLVLNKIAAQEKIEAPQKDVELETERVMQNYKDADPSRVRVYVETVLTNEKVFEFLEKQG